MRILVTGATGFIGRRLVESLIDHEGAEVAILYRRNGHPPLPPHPRVRVCEGDLLDAGSVRRAMEGCDRAYHLAAYAKSWARDPAAFFDANVRGVRHVFAAAREAGVRRVVFTSTAMTIGSAAGGPADETTPPPASNRTYYGQSKLAAEEEARRANAAGLEVVTVNPTRVFGPGLLTEANSVTRLIQLRLEGRWRWILGTGREVGNYAFIDDVVAGHRLAMERGRPGERYLLGGTNIGFRDLLETIGEFSRHRVRLVRVPVALALLLARVETARARWTRHQPLISPEWVRTFLTDWAYTSAKAERELGYRPTLLREAIDQTIEWIQRTGRALRFVDLHPGSTVQFTMAHRGGTEP